MHFGLSEEQELLQQTLRDFAAGECPPAKRRELFDAGVGNDPALWRGLADLGVAGLVVPEAYGGAGLEWLDMTLACEVAGASALPAPLLEHALACLAIDTAGSEEQKQRWLPKLAKGDALATVGLAEGGGSPGTRWEPAAWETGATDGRLFGEKVYVPNAAQADVIVVGTKGGLALVSCEHADLEIEDQGGIDRARPVSRLRFEGTACERLEAGTVAARRVRDAGLVALAADAFGAASQLVATCADYAKERRQFGLPIGQFQAVKHQIARIGTEIEPTRALFWYAAHALDCDLADAERSVAMAKAHITDRAMEVARTAVELHGGQGFTWECDVQIFFKRVMYDRAWLGTPEVQRERCARLAGW